MGSKFGRLKGFREILSWKNTWDLAFPLGLSFTVEFFHDLQGKLQPPCQIDVVPTGRESYGLLFFFWVRFTKCQADRTIIWQNCIALYCNVCSLSLSFSLQWFLTNNYLFSPFFRLPWNDVPGPWLVMTLPSTTALASWGWKLSGEAF